MSFSGNSNTFLFYLYVEDETLRVQVFKHNKGTLITNNGINK